MNGVVVRLEVEAKGRSASRPSPRAFRGSDWRTRFIAVTQLFEGIQHVEDRLELVDLESRCRRPGRGRTGGGRRRRSPGHGRLSPGEEIKPRSVELQFAESSRISPNSTVNQNSLSQARHVLRIGRGQRRLGRRSGGSPRRSGPREAERARTRRGRCPARGGTRWPPWNESRPSSGNSRSARDTRRTPWRREVPRDRTALPARQLLEESIDRVLPFEGAGCDLAPA